MAKWQIDTAHAGAEFQVKHLDIAWVTGQMYGVEGTVDYDPESPADTAFEATLDVTTITTGDENRDGHLLSEDFFDAENHPKLKFTSKEVTEANTEEATVVGDLTIAGQTKEVELHVHFMGQAEMPNPDGTATKVAAFSAHTQIDRREFGLEWNMDLPGGKLLVGNMVDIRVNVEAKLAE